MKLRAAFIGAALLVSGQSMAAVSVTSVVDTLTNLELSFNWDGETSFSQQVFSYLSSNWSVKGNLTAFALPGNVLNVNAAWSGLRLAQLGASDTEAVQALGSLTFVSVAGQPTYIDGYNTQVAMSYANGHSDTYHFMVTGTGNNGIANTATLTAVHAVPEPETYAMLLAGLGVVGWRLRQRRNFV